MLADTLRALLVCPICARLLSAPSTLACGHSICAHHFQPCPRSHPPARSPSSSKVAVLPPPPSYHRAPHPAAERKPDVILNSIVAFLENDRNCITDDAHLEKAILNELTCVVCFVLLYEPVTTPCQHTFCTHCLHRSLDHSNACPVCRKDLPSFAHIQELQPNHAILSIILEVFPKQYQERAQAMEAEARDARLDTPIFVCHLSFPGTPTVLHLFEPRYRLMLRRCLESSVPRFGMTMPPNSGSPQVDYGTMLEIRSVQMLADGRSIVETWGTHRFRIMERGNLDGYMVGRVERVDDYPDDIFDSQATPTNAELMQTCRTFLDRLQRGSAPWVVQRLNRACGTIPDDPSAFSFWVALVLPIDEQDKAKLLPIRSARLRLLLVTHWIEQLNNTWYASGYISGQWWDRGAAGGFRADVKFYDVVLPNQDNMELTAIQAHYLKKALIQLQFRRELELITSADPPFNVPHPNPAFVGTSSCSVSTLSYLGPPFASPPQDAPHLDLPFLRYIFQQFVLTFPFLSAAPKDFYSAKLQPFVSSILARGITGEDGLDQLLDDKQKQQEDDPHRHRKVIAKLERNLAMFLGAATKLVEPEQVVRLSQSDLDRLEKLAQKRAKNRKEEVFEVNVVCVRTVVDRGRVRSRVHEEFIVRTRRTGHRDVFVSRRYGDFRTLAKELAKAHSDEHIRQPPAKDKTLVNGPSAPTGFSSVSSPDDLYSDGPNFSDSPLRTVEPSRLAREKNRLTLRAYLHSLMSSSVVASSPVLRSFLLSGPTSLTAEEYEDARRREEADRLRDDGRKKFAKEIATRVDSLRDAIRSVKGDIMGKDGLTHVFATIKETPDIKGLPENYKSIIEWARISLASTIFHHYVASDDASETFAGLKRVHGLMPYFMLKTALKISNPIGMIRSILDLFLAQPFGGKSLLQRMFTSSLTEEARALQEQIDAVKDKIDDPMMCAKVRQFVYASRDVQELFKVDAASDSMHVLTVVLRSAEEPVLSRPQMNRIARAHRAHMAYLKCRASLQDSDDDDGPQDDDAWLIEDLKVLAHLYSRLRDREQLIELIFEGFTADLLKDIITIFYAPLAQVYKAASIADSLGDLQNFINDLIRTVEQVEELSQDDPHHTVQVFIDLVQRHEQSFYYFVHKVHAKGEGLFVNLMRWIELFLTLSREGLGGPISIDSLIPHAGKERQDILEEIDKVSLYHYKLKVLHENKLRRRFGKAQGQNEADAEDEATEALVNDAVGEISLGELARADADDYAAEQSEDEDESSEDDEYSSSEDTDSSGEDETEESFQDARRPIQHSPRPPPTRAQTMAPQPPKSPKRSLSMKSLRSLANIRRSHEATPVPPLPLKIPDYLTSPSSSTARSPTRPPSVNGNATLQRCTSPVPNSASIKSSTPHSSRGDRPKERKKREPLKPPELVHIPELLPIFVEMMRDLLQPR